MTLWHVSGFSLCTSVVAVFIRAGMDYFAIKANTRKPVLPVKQKEGPYREE